MSSLEWLFTKGYKIFQRLFGLFLIFVSFCAMIAKGFAEQAGNMEALKYSHATMYMCGAMGIGIIAASFKKK